MGVWELGVWAIFGLAAQSFEAAVHLALFRHILSLVNIRDLRLFEFLQLQLNKQVY